jgi:Dolichyl-phosphate-mannose-protein mannosyltransferase
MVRSLRVISHKEAEANQERQPLPTADSASLERANNFLPEALPSERWIALAIFLLSFLYLCIFRRYSWVDPDEGIILQGAQRILNGQVLYRDFFSFFTPGSYYFIALVFRIFGDSYLVSHTTLAFVGATFSPITYLLVRRVCSRQTSLLITSLMTLTAVPSRFVVIHNWDSTLWACLALYTAVRFLESGSSAWAFASSTFTSLTGLSEQSKGAGLLMGLGIGFLIIASRGKQRKLFARDQAIAILAGLGAPFLLTIIYFASHHALTTMLGSWFWPLQHYSVANRVPYAYDNLTGQARDRIFAGVGLGMRLFAMLIFSSRTWIPYLPILALALLIRLLFQRRRTIASEPDWAYYILVTSTMLGLLISIVIARSDYLHFIFLQPIFFLLLGWLLDGRNILHPWFKRIAPLLGLCLSMSLLARAAQSLITSRGEYTVTTRRGVITEDKPDDVIAFVQAHVAAGENTLIYPYQPTYYYLTRTLNPTRLDFYQPGMHTQQQLQEMLMDLSAHPTRAVLYEPTFTEHLLEAWPNTPSNAVASDVVAAYLQGKYHVCTTLNAEIEFMIRNDLVCPDEGRQSPPKP